MEAKTNYTLVGLAVLVLTGSFLTIGLWLSVGFHQKSYKTYAVYIHEAVSGLNEEAPVKFNGVQVGQVKKIQLNIKDPQQVTLILNIEEATPITTSTTATLISQGITGNTFVGLTANSSDLTPLQKIANEPYPIIPSKPSLFTHLDTVLKEVTDNINSVSKRINVILDEKNADSLQKTLINVEAFTHTLADNNKTIYHILKDTQVLTQQLTVSSKKLPNVLQEIGTMADNVSQAGQQFRVTMQTGKVAIDKISQQTLPLAQAFVQRLDAIGTNIEQLSANIRDNPAIVLRGSAPPKPGPGE